MRIYSIFYILLLESKDLRIPVFTKTPTEYISENKYEVKEITDYNSKTKRYTVKWKEYFIKENL